MTWHHADIAIFGGGIAGLAILDQLRGAGYSPVLIQHGPLGGGQTIAAQGIVHRGLKYALDGRVGRMARRLADAPERWRRLAGPDPALWRSDCMHLWVPAGAGSGLMAGITAGLLASATLKVAPECRPATFRAAPDGGVLLRLDEPVLDVPALLSVWAARHRDAIIAISDSEAIEFKRTGSERLAAADLGDGRTIQADAFVFACGAGQPALMAKLGLDTVRTCRRPLRQLVVRGDLPVVHVHCLGSAGRPLLTITSHRAADGATVWYVGGDIAEGNDDEPIARFRAIMARHMPWFGIDGAVVRVAQAVRAEPLDRLGRRPSGPVLHRDGNMLFAWPLKLAHAPALAAEVGLAIEQLNIAPRPAPVGLRADPVTIARPPWDAVPC